MLAKRREVTLHHVAKHHVIGRGLGYSHLSTKTFTCNDALFYNQGNGKSETAVCVNRGPARRAGKSRGRAWPRPPPGRRTAAPGAGGDRRGDGRTAARWGASS